MRRALRFEGLRLILVMPALVAGIHVLPFIRGETDVDGRDKPGHDGKR
jgi:hypothetical protein